MKHAAIQPLRHGVLCLACAVLSAGCGGGGGGAASAPVASPSPVVAAPDAPAVVPQVLTGNRHLTVNWPAMAGAVDYAVWFQQVGTGPELLSRGAIAATAPRVHTITNLALEQRYRVWVKARLADDSRIVSASVVASPVTTPVSTPLEQPAFVPAVIDLPVLDIATTGALPIVSRDDYLTATFALYANGAARMAATALASGAMDIRGRGNTSWDQFPKKPYRLKLNTSTALLGMPANRHWVLIANQGDKSLLRNETAFELSRRFGMAYTPRSRLLEVFLNGNYVGHYEMAEHLRTGSNRVNIASLGAADNAEPAVSGGYFLELDRPNPDTTFSTAGCALPMTLDTPETPTPAQSAYIQAYMNNAEAVLLGSGFADPATGYAAWLEVGSFVDWYIIHELTLNVDAFRASTFFYKDRSAKLAIGPVWDFDIAMGNYIALRVEDPGGTTSFGPVSQTCWYRRLLQDPAFVQKVKARWQAVRTTQLASIPDYVDARAAALAQSQANNFSRWTILDKADWSNVVVTGSHAGEVEYLRYWLQRRIAWLDTQWN